MQGLDLSIERSASVREAGPGSILQNLGLTPSTQAVPYVTESICRGRSNQKVSDREGSRITLQSPVNTGTTVTSYSLTYGGRPEFHYSEKSVSYSSYKSSVKTLCRVLTSLISSFFREEEVNFSHTSHPLRLFVLHSSSFFSLFFPLAPPHIPTGHDPIHVTPRAPFT